MNAFTARTVAFRLRRQLALDDVALLDLYPGYATAADAREELRRELAEVEAE